jgi:hypothetical protein
MKKIFTFLLLSAMVGTSQLAEAGSGDQTSPNARATQMVKQLAKKIQLSEGQYVKVRQLNLRLLNDVQAVKAQSAGDAAAIDQQLAELQSHYEWDLTAILGPRQMVAYNQSKADMMAMSVGR